MALAFLVPRCIHFFQGLGAESGKEQEQIKNETSDVNFYDPFSDDPQSTERVPSVVAKTKFVEIGSGTEELGFDWIVSPFEFTEK